jgi:hypothetical protein
VTGQFEPQGATAAKLDLESFPPAGVAVVFGASGGIGGALVEAIRTAERFEHVVEFSRSASPSIDLLDEASLERAAAFAADKGDLRLVIDATGFLHDDRQGPEKSWRQLDAVNLARSFALNAIGPALIMKHVLPRLPRSGKAVGGVPPIAYLDIIARRLVTAKLPAPISMALAAIVAGALWKGARPLASK